MTQDDDYVDAVKTILFKQGLKIMIDST